MIGGRFRIELGSRLPAALIDEVRRRFGSIDVTVLDNTTVITTAALDQAALRSLLELLWDGAGHVRSVSRPTAPQVRAEDVDERRGEP